jgi:hypothetical protein
MADFMNQAIMHDCHAFARVFGQRRALIKLPGILVVGKHDRRAMIAEFAAHGIDGQTKSQARARGHQTSWIAIL